MLFQSTFSVASVAAPTGKRRRLLRGSNSSYATSLLSQAFARGTPTAPPNHAEIMGSDSPTAKDVPAYTTEPDWPDPVSRSTTSERVVDVVPVNVAA